LRGYRLALAIEARRFKRVPDQAQAEGWAGTADVRLAIAAGGQAISVELAKSSGYAALDTAALSMIDAAAQRALLPPQLQQRAFVLTLPVVFKAAE
jgi:protein TonB